MTSIMQTQAVYPEPKIILHIEGRVVEINKQQQKEIRATMGKIRRMADGTLVYPARGKPPEVPEGYIRDPGDPYQFKPILPCPHQEQQTRRLSCGKLRAVVYCTYRKGIITEDICLTCEKCPL